MNSTFCLHFCYCRDLDYDAKRLSLIRQIDFAWAVEKDEEKKKQKSSRETSTTWQWQDLVENLQLAHQELSVIIDLINTVSNACYFLSFMGKTSRTSFGTFFRMKCLYVA